MLRHLEHCAAPPQNASGWTGLTAAHRCRARTRGAGCGNAARRPVHFGAGQCTRLAPLRAACLAWAGPGGQRRVMAPGCFCTQAASDAAAVRRRCWRRGAECRQCRAQQRWVGGRTRTGDPGRCQRGQEAGDPDGQRGGGESAGALHTRCARRSSLCSTAPSPACSPLPC